MPPTHATASCSRPAAGAPPPGCALRVPGHTTPGCTHPQGSASCYLCPLYVLAVAGEECPRLSGAVLHQRGRLRPSTAAAGAITAADGGGLEGGAVAGTSTVLSRAAQAPPPPVRTMPAPAPVPAPPPLPAPPVPHPTPVRQPTNRKRAGTAACSRERRTGPPLACSLPGLCCARTQATARRSVRLTHSAQVLSKVGCESNARPSRHCSSGVGGGVGGSCRAAVPCPDPAQLGPGCMQTPPSLHAGPGPPACMGAA